MSTFLAVPVAPSPHRRRVSFVSLGVLVAVLLAAGAAAAAFLWSPIAALSAPFTPSAASGSIATPVSIDDGSLPAIAKLDPALREAVRAAGAAAAAEGVELGITGGWRSREYQQWLLEDAIESYGDEGIARQFVATPDRSHHVSGDAVDIGSLDAQLWLIEHGAQWGLCQIYANERWHFELATDPGGACPALLADAEG
ncbi:M15 family metallopeptidase [Microbacterium sp. HJ5]